MQDNLSEQLHLRLPAEATQAIRMAAKREYLNPGAYVRRLIMREIERLKEEGASDVR